MLEPINCPACNKEVQRGHFNRHMKNKSHIKNATEKGFVYENEYKKKHALKNNIKNRLNIVSENLADLKRFEKYILDFN